MKNILIILFLLSSIFLNSQVSLIIGDGQSNMAGILDPSPIAQNLRASPYSFVWDSTTNNFMYAIHFPNGKDYALTSQPRRGKYITPFNQLARSISNEAPQEYYLVMYAIGGSQLYNEVGVTDWNVNSVGEYYDNYKSTIQSAINSLSAKSLSIDTIFRIKFQGEADAITETKANAFYQNELDFIDSLEVNFNYPFFHILTEITTDYTYSATINTALATIASERSNVILYTNDSFTYAPDLHHITNESQINYGDSLFKIINH